MDYQQWIQQRCAEVNGTIGSGRISTHYSIPFTTLERWERILMNERFLDDEGIQIMLGEIQRIIRHMKGLS